MKFSDTFETDVATERMICSQYLFRLKPTFLCVARGAAYQEQDPEFEQPFIDELFEQLYTYSDKIYVMERDGAIWGFVPTMFFSSATVLAVRFNVAAGVALRCLEKSAYRDMFEYSPKITAKKSRSTKINDTVAQFDAFLKKLNGFLHETSDSADNSKDAICAFRELCVRCSHLTGTPAAVELGEVEDPQLLSGEIDFSLFRAFLITWFLIAREKATDRSVRVSFDMLSQSVVAIVEFRTEEDDVLRTVSLWDGICADMLMPFGTSYSNGVLKVGIQPCRRELSYLGLKQITDWLN